MKAPTDNEIMLAEQRYAVARSELSTASGRANVAFHDALVKPGTLLGIAGAAGLLGYYVFKPAGPRPKRRKPGEAEAPSTATTAATSAVASTGIAGIAMAMFMRYAMQQMSGVGMGMVRQMFRQRPGRAPAAVDPSQVRPTTTLH